MKSGEFAGVGEVHEDPGAAAAMAPPVPFVAPVEDAAEEKEREKAFDGVYRWRGAVLEPFSIGREGLFQEMRTAMGAPSLMQVFRGDAHAFLADALRILFLCSHPAAVLRGMRGDAAALQGAVDDWAEEFVTRAEKGDAVLVGMRIWSDSQEGEHEPVPSGESDAVGN